VGGYGGGTRTKGSERPKREDRRVSRPPKKLEPPGGGGAKSLDVRGSVKKRTEAKYHKGEKNSAQAKTWNGQLFFLTCEERDAVTEGGFWQWAPSPRARKKGEANRGGKPLGW